MARKLPQRLRNRAIPVIDGDTFIEILSITGYKMSEASLMFDRSRSYVTNMFHGLERVPFRFVRIFMEKAGQDVFWSAFEVATQGMDDLPAAPGQPNTKLQDAERQFAMEFEE